jgi:hypothetical protein
MPVKSGQTTPVKATQITPEQSAEKPADKPSEKPADKPAGTPTGDRYAAETAHHHPTKPGTTEDEAIRQEAYAIWEMEGRPDGQHEAHWQKAEERMKPVLVKSPPGR